jgi:two-component system phosphate regulon sensor histidine kinase PhoR
MGLTVAKAMVDLHKGEIHVESVEGKGSKFTIILPAVTKATRALMDSSENI